MKDQNGSMHWIAVLKKAEAEIDRVIEGVDDADEGDGWLEWLIWGGFWFAAGAIVAWWATA